jgi:small subunit ribosomal protein S14
MAKKSKIVKNEQRRATVAHYAEHRAEIRDILRRPSSTATQRADAQAALHGCPATPARCGCATGMPSTGVPAGTCGSSACRGYGYVSSPTTVNCPEYGRPVGSRMAG